MDDAINTSAWGQVNTFMDIIGPRVKNTTTKAEPAKSQTLMRRAVKKPEPQTAAIDTPSTRQQFSDVASRPNLAAAAVLTDRSPLISRFTPNADYQEADSLTHRVEPIDVQQYPSMDGDTVAQENYQAPSMSSEATAIAIDAPGINIFKDPQPGTFEYSRASKTYNESKWALAKRISGWSVLGLALVSVLVGGLYLNRNFNKVELYVASSRAGFAATLPAAKPVGYSLNSLSTGGGVVEASFSSSNNGQSYTISEKKSNVSSSSLLSNYVVSKAGLNYQTINSGDKTIYVYGNHDATWVSNGIWYVLEDNNGLTNPQIIKMANSM